MELFFINRYTGDELNNEKTPSEEKLRRKLHKKIEKRKRIRKLSLEEEGNLEQNKRIKYECDSSVENNILSETENSEFSKTKPVSAKENKTVESEQTSFSESQNITSFSIKIVKKNKKDKEPEDEYKNFSNGDIADNNEGNNEEKIENEKQTGFTLLGDVHMTKTGKIKRKLPNWLANPLVVSVNLKNLTYTVDSIPELDIVFLDELKKNGITHFFPVQSQVIPWLLRHSSRPRMYWPNDICVSAPTGSGKTLAFVLPILQLLHKRVVPRIRALAVLPVQDLANQVFNVFKTYSKPTNLKILLLTKKRPFEEEQSLICRSDGMGNYRIMIDIIVTTPGRLVDHLTKTKGLCLNDLTYLIIDEADRVMESIQNDWLYHLNKHIYSECNYSYQIPVISYNNMIKRKRPPNKFLFSATLSQDPEKLQQLGLFQPKLFTSVVKLKTSDENGTKDETRFIGKYTTPAELTEYYIISTKTNKPLILYHLLKSKSWKKVLCFVNSSEATSRLAFVLKSLRDKDTKIGKIGKLSANLNVKKRDQILKNFSEGKINVLVSSDALARGIDISNVQYVISYDAPRYVKNYIHRIGRTGRAGKEGTSVVLLTPKEKNSFQKMIETAGKTSIKELIVTEEEIQEYQSSYEEAIKSLKSLLEKKKKKKISNIKIKKKLQIQGAKGKSIKTHKKK